MSATGPGGKVRVVTDSACDLPDDVARRHGIDVVPLTIRFGDEEFVDRRDLTPEQFWVRVSESQVLPQTAAPSPGAFEAAFRRAAEEGCSGVACITISSDLSATIQSAQLAASAVESAVPVRVIDSRSLTMGQGVMCIAAARAAAAGQDLAAVGAAAEELIGRTRVYAALDTLENLKKGGRIGGAQAMLGSVLSIKPIIAVRDGRVEPESKQRTRARSLRYLVDKVAEHPRVENLAVMHGHAPDLEEFLDLMAAVYPRDDILVGEVGAVIGAHAGPRVIGVTFHTST
jgi:DegV family protein with EDD domain